MTKMVGGGAACDAGTLRRRCLGVLADGDVEDAIATEPVAEADSGAAYRVVSDDLVAEMKPLRRRIVSSSTSQSEALRAGGFARMLT